MAISFAVTIWLIVLATIYLFSGQMGWFPPQVSEHGGAIDDQFFYTLIVVGVAFTLAQVILGYYVWRYRSSAHKEVTYTHGNTKVEIVATVVTAVVFVTLAIMGQKVWAQLHLQGIPEGAIKVEVTAQQFAWNIRYPGADGQFGRTIPQLINDQLNPVGVDPKDPASEDDIVTLNRMAIPVNRDIQITLRSKDVTNSFFVPALRFKQDTTPGMAISSHFKALKIGDVSETGLRPYTDSAKASYIMKDLHKRRNFRLAFKRGFFGGSIRAGMMTVSGGRFPGNKIEVLEDIAEDRVLGSGGPVTQPDGKLTFSKTDSVYKAGNQTRDDIPSHLIPGTDVSPEVAEMYVHMCPAGVYEWDGESLTVNAPNCVDCKATEVLVVVTVSPVSYTHLTLPTSDLV